MTERKQTPTRHGERLIALQKILEYCNTETWSYATRVRRITSVAQAGIRGSSSEMYK